MTLIGHWSPQLEWELLPLRLLWLTWEANDFNSGWFSTRVSVTLVTSQIFENTVHVNKRHFACKKDISELVFHPY